MKRGPGFKSVLSRRDVEAIIADYRGGSTMEAVARSHNVSNATVRYHLRKNNVELRIKGARSLFTNELRAAIIADRGNGMIFSELAAKYGGSTCLMHRICKRASAQPHTQGATDGETIQQV